MENAPSVSAVQAERAGIASRSHQNHGVNGGMVHLTLGVDPSGGPRSF